MDKADSSDSLFRAEQELADHRRLLAEEANACGGAPLTQATSHRLAQAHLQLARSFEILGELHRSLGNELVADYPDS